MAWNESRLWMAAPGWQPRIDESARLAHSSLGIPVISFHQEKCGTLKIIDAEELRAWLEMHEFKPLKHAIEVLKNGEIEVSIEQVDGIVSSVRLTFVIFDPFHKQIFIHDCLNTWMHFICELAHVWNFRLLDPKSWQPIAETDFKQALRNTPACEGIAF